MKSSALAKYKSSQGLSKEIKKKGIETKSQLTEMKECLKETLILYDSEMKKNIISMSFYSLKSSKISEDNIASADSMRTNS